MSRLLSESSGAVISARSICSLCLVAFWAVVLSLFQIGRSSAQQQLVFSGHVDRVVLAVGVLDNDGLPVAALGIDEFRVREDGEERRITGVLPSSDTPLDLALLVDVSGSVEEYKEQIDRGVSMFLDSLLSRDCVVLIHFNGLVRPGIWGHPDEPVLREALPFTGEPSGTTAVYDALIEGLVAVDPDGPVAWARKEAGSSTSPFVSMPISCVARSGRVAASVRFLAGPIDASEVPAEGQPDAQRRAHRRALVIVTDGKDGGSRHSYLDALAAAWETNIPVFVLAVGSLGRFGSVTRRARARYGSLQDDITREQFRDLADLTGGQLLVAQVPRVVQSSFDKILDRLRSYYYVTFEPSPNDEEVGRWHDVEVKLRPSGLKAFHASQYFRSAVDTRAARSSVRGGLENLEAGRLDDALSEFQQATWADPDLMDAHYHTARALVRQGRTGEALSAFQRASSRSPGVADRQIAQISLQIGDLQAAWEHAIQAHIAGFDMTDLFAQLHERSDAPVDLRQRLSVPRIFVPEVLVADPVVRTALRPIIKALRRGLWNSPDLGLVHSDAHAAYATRLVIDRLPDDNHRDVRLDLEVYNRGGRRVFREEIKAQNVDDEARLVADFAEALGKLCERLADLQ